MEITGNCKCLPAVKIAAKILGANLKEGKACDCSCASLKDGAFTVHTTPAILRYLASKEAKKHQLLGKDFKDDASIEQFLVMGHRLSDKFNVAAGTVKCPCMVAQFNKVANQAARECITGGLEHLNTHLRDHTFLACERLTIADLLLFVSVARIFPEFVHKADTEKKYQNIFRWMNTVHAVDAVKAVIPKVEFATTTLPEEPIVAPGAPAKTCGEKAGSAVEEGPQMDLYAWKKHYKNLDWEGGEHWEPYFWEHYLPESYSMWLVTYQFPDTLLEDWKSKNLVSLWLQRLRGEKADKDSFGNILVTKVASEKHHKVVGVFMFKGHTVPSVITDCSGSASFDFVRIDDKTEDAKKFISDVWNWNEDSDIVYKGVNYGKTCDGETFH